LATDDIRTDADKEHVHPGVGQYVEIGVILAVLTLIEVVLFEAMEGGLFPLIGIPSLLLLTLMKFMLVVLWFMHLRFDHKLFRRLFFAGVILAIVLYSVLAADFFLGGGPGTGF
jgi:cytochrome c oxidase subunit 4